MKTTIHPLSATLLLAALFGLAACGPKDGAPQASAAGAAPPPPEVDTVTIARGSLELTQDLPGRLSAYRSAQVRARVEGIIEKRQFVEGSDVKEGNTLFHIDDRNYQAAYAAASADTELARQTVERYTRLYDLKMVSQQDFDLARTKLKLAEAALSKAQLDLENTRVPAPISGRIGRAQVTEGALVGRGDATLLATIEQIDPVYADFTQSGADLLRLQQAFKSGKLKRSGSAQVQLGLED
ncbi:MAG: efflux RND transporter periplasmic adaptor subunit, partial [Gammaproteobacteria bacterium]|nr:efflux RND transporter periplasmic adaptor subunit [Gammaproteobacteria bacterium]